MKKILIIEDSKTINKLIAKELQKVDFTTQSAYSLKEAREYLGKNHYDLIILDMHLPDGEGSELIANIQSLTKTKVVVLTSLQDEGLREELFEYGILDYIIKDTNLLYSISEIVKIIHNITTKKKDAILLIDDSRFISKQIRTILEPRNYSVTPALDAKSALKILGEEEFSLIILDMELPDMHGLDLLEIIRRNGRFLHIPIIVLSGTSTPEIVRNVLKNGANDFLKKPFVFEEFILKIDLWVDYFKKEKELQEKNMQLSFLNNNLEKLVKEEVEKNRAKEKMMFAQSRHAQMGEMIAMIAHQWRQPLNTISVSTTLLDLKLKSPNCDPKELGKITSKIRNLTQYLSDTIDDFKDFFKPQKEKQLTNFEIILNKTLRLIEHSLKNDNIVLEIKVKNPQSFMSYENELIQVLLNLLKNAQDACIQNNIQNPKITIEIQDKSITVSDNAGGIPNNIIEKIFDPYFSTKEKKSGTGLGLYMSKIIVEEHCNGSLHVSNTQEGASFNITLR